MRPSFRVLLGLPRALGFLTLVPMPRAIWRASLPADLVLPWFPVVGFLLGLVLSGALILAESAFRASPALLAGSVCLLLWALLTGGLHLDGLGDVLDGLARRGSPEERKEVLRDPHIGSVGAAGLAVFVALKLGAIVASPPLGVLAAPVVARTAVVLCMCLFPYGRPGERTLGSSLWPEGRAQVAATTLLAATICLGPFGTAAGALGLLLPSAVGILWALLMGAFLSRAFGGLTGDCCGAVCETTEVVSLLAFGLAQ